MVRDIDAVDAVLDRERRVLAGGDALRITGIFDSRLIRSMSVQLNRAW